VLVARRPRSEAPFPGRLLVATDGSEGSAAATRLAGAIARRHGSSVMQLHVNGASSRHAMAVEAAELRRMTGAEPVPLTETGPAHERIVAAARSQRASLVVLGSRGLRGIRALGSVSERVVHEARCSVLIARPGPAAE
jgi:nucleotide-binding universal stress UspA family protein